MNAKASRLQMPRLWNLGLVAQTGAYLRHAVCPRSLLRKCLDEALDVFRDRFVFLRRSQFRQHVGVCEHVEAERSGERSALNAEPADVLCGRLLNAESEEVPGGEGLEVFDFLHDVQAIKKPPACAEGLLKMREVYESKFINAVNLYTAGRLPLPEDIFSIIFAD